MTISLVDTSTLSSPMTLDAFKKNQNAVGIFCAFSAYIIWGFQPMYWKAIITVDPWVVIAHRYCWTTLAIFLFIVLSGQWHSVVATARKFQKECWKFGVLALASLMALLNWWFNIYAPMNGHIVELGIGLFLTPLLSILLGVVFYRERLNIFQKISVSLAILGVAIMFWRFGTIPWISLGVSSTWATYGALKKRILLIPAVAIFFESLIAVPFALTFLYYVGESAFFARLGDFEFTAWALVGTGVITSVPLIAYTYATNYLPLNLLGFCQYLSPILVLCLGIFVYGKKFGWDEIFPMTFVWAGIFVYLFGPRLFHSSSKAH